MYHTISQERCLFFIDSHFVETFQILADDFSKEELEVEANLYNLEHSWTSVFNIWILLQSDEHLIVQDFSKSLYYSVNQLLIKAIKNNYHFKALRSSEKRSQELIFISSIFLANGVSYWLQQLLIENNLHDLAIKLQNLDYYDFHKKSREEIEPILTIQARCVKVVAPQLNANGPFNRMLKTQIDKAYFYYRDHYSLKKGAVQ